MTMRPPTRSFTQPLIALLLALLLVPAASAREPAAEPGAQGLGERFEGEYAGVTFRPPGDVARVAERVGELARYVGEAEEGQAPPTFLAERVELPGTGLPLTSRAARPGDERVVPGLLEASAAPHRNDPSSAVLREDVIYVNDADIGVLAVEASGVSGRLLTQVALVRVNDTTYFRLTYTTPLPADADPTDSPEVRRAAEAFAAVLDTVALVDLSDVRARQEDWLINTRSLLVNWTQQKVTESLTDRRYFLVRVAGRSVGYMAVTEEPAGGLPADDGEEAQVRDGVRVGIRSHLRDASGRLVDREKFAYFRFNRASGAGQVRERSRDREEWTTTSVFRSPEQADVHVETPGLAFVTEIGTSQRQTVLVPDPLVEGENRGVVSREVYELQVTRAGRDGADPTLERELPAYYVPQALAHLAPRLLPLERPRGYLFAEWVPSRTEVMARYLEVLEGVRDVTLAGEDLRARVVTDKIGLTGSVTEHYFDPESGRYLGSRDKAAKREVVPATREQVAAEFSGAK